MSPIPILILSLQLTTIPSANAAPSLQLRHSDRRRRYLDNAPPNSHLGSMSTISLQVLAPPWIDVDDVQTALY
ncbi:hypothetical protein KC19_VG069800 [Ceratodon purpureus]|uniref:Uncharacterized protein n=1 Tax=Ceratodon purpureus TaxID=3225 RepID=A0A8T0HMR6_CERPU|nr:hypothetical protein KC19_VG069800 [Ceratodon purpureus]